MPRKVICQCGRVLIVQDRHVALAVRCPKCESQVLIPPTPRKSQSSARRAPQPSNKRAGAELASTASDVAIEPPPPPTKSNIPPTPPPLPNKTRIVAEPIPPTGNKAKPTIEARRETPPPAPVKKPPVQPPAPKPQQKATADKVSDKKPAPPTAHQPPQHEPAKEKKAEQRRLSQPEPKADAPQNKTIENTQPSAPATSVREESRASKSTTVKTEPAPPVEKPTTESKTSKETPPAPPAAPPEKEQPQRREPPPQSDPEPAARRPSLLSPWLSTDVKGHEHHPSQIAAVYYLAAAMALAALLGLGPAVWETIDHFRNLEDSPGVARWAYVLLFLSVVQFGYVVYLVQLPDWSTVWAATLLTVALAAGYALMLGAALMSPTDPPQIVALLELDAAAYSKTAGWCFVMLCVTFALSYFCGRVSVRWHHSCQMLQSVQKASARL